ncbi:peptidylprolyl isomerase [Virgibacillus oceani]|uniref:Foldase protein PrsA n=1 Tax=Virgibacillus oceani TaxID=1479511 RepID=A0A917M386_9BACI|nr:peptidylprolyl isomerase [Virgibacillus oceani]GGG74903.1 foldase protein PrsA [Virgibacillus oceani]
MKKVAIAVTLTAGVLSLSACSSGDDSEVVVETNAGNITKDEFYQELKDRYGDAVIQEMVTAEVLDDKYEVTDKEVDKEVQKTKDQLGEQFEMALQQQGIKDEDAYRDLVRISLLQEAAISEDIEITDKEIKQRYDRMKQEIEAQHILVEDEKTAKEVKKKLDEGGDFAKLAKEYSTDTATAEEGGKLGFFSAGKMDPAFEDAAYNLEVGKISDPVKSEFGYHIIKVTDKRDKEEDIGKFEDMKEDIRRQILNQKIDPQKAQAKIQSLLDDAKIDPKDDDFEGLFEKEDSKEEK